MNVMSDITVTANFAINTYTLTYTAGPNGSITGTSPQTVNYGADGTAVTAVPDTGYHFVNWSDTSTDNPRTDMNVMSDITVTANFAINTYTLTYTAGPNGSITGTSPQMVNYGGSGTAVTAVPDTGYHFVNWSDASTDNPRTDMNVMSDITVTANFAINTYTLTYTAGPNGSITGTSPQTVNYGGSGTAVTAVADSGYHFANWSDASTSNPRTDTNVMMDITVTANFAINASNNADLSNLAASAGALSPAFDPNTLSYTVNTPFSTTSTTVTPTASDAGATITVNGNPVTSGNPSGSISLNVGNNMITVVVTAADTTTMKTYTINVIRAAPTTVYVDDDWAGTTFGDDPDGIGPATSFGEDAFATIQGGVNGVAPSPVANGGNGINLPAVLSTVIVYAGNYPEAVTVGKSVIILGAKAGVDANTRFAAFVSGPNGPKADPMVESILTAAATAPASAANDTLHIMADNVTINGFVIDGNNPALAQGGATVIGGINTDSRRAIQTEDAAGTAFAANNLTVAYNVIQNFSQRGVELINGTASNTAPATSGNLITRNLVRNFGLDAIVMAFNAYADVTFNTVVTNDYPTEAGIWVQDFLDTGTPHTMNITDNNVTVGQDNFGGIWVNLAYLAAVNIDNNTVNAAAGVVSGSDFTYGIYVTSLRPGTTATVSGNTVGASGGQFDRGIALWNVGTSPTTTTVKDGSVKNSVDGISLVDNDANFGPAGSSAAAKVSGMTVSGSQVGVMVDAAGSGASTVTMAITNSTLSGNTAATGGGITSVGTGGSASTTVTNSTLSGNSPTGASILFTDASLTVANSIFNTVTPGTTISALGTSLVTSLGYNLSRDEFGGFLTNTGDQINTDPILGPLKNNGGPTFTHAPLSNSPAIDRGKDLGPIGPDYDATGEDQRGSTRPVTYDASIILPAGGDRSDIGAVELPPGVIPTSAESRKTHGGAGDFDINLPLSGLVGIECRSGGATNAYQVIIDFANPVTYTSAALSDGTGIVATDSGSGTNQITLNLTGVTNAQRITLALFGTTDTVTLNSGDVGLRMGVLVGDVTGERYRKRN